MFIIVPMRLHIDGIPHINQKPGKTYFHTMFTKTEICQRTVIIGFRIAAATGQSPGFPLFQGGEFPSYYRIHGIVIFEESVIFHSHGDRNEMSAVFVRSDGEGIDAVYFHAPPYTSERAKDKVVDLAKKVSKYCGKIKLHVVNFTDIQLAIYDHCPHDELTIIMRRYMMKIAERFAAANGCHGLITGESIGQVASQTMQSLACTNEVCEMPVFRPLIAFDKQDIIDIAQKIDTYETSVLPYEDCCTIFVAKHPVTKPDLGRIKKSEKKLEGIIEELLEKAVESTQIIEIED